VTTYAEFLARKEARGQQHGRAIEPTAVHPALHRWQAEIVTWAVRTGRAAIWADTGLGKTRQQLEWARLSAPTSLIVAPLAVCAQTVREAAAIDIQARYVRAASEITRPGVWVTNYEMIDRFDPDDFGAVVLDEASILKQSDGKTRAKLISQFSGVPHRLACTATPAPNDPEELTNQAEFLGVMPRVDIHRNRGPRAWPLSRHPSSSWTK
jgi:superfamily II DNA or RNA helicase